MFCSLPLSSSMTFLTILRKRISISGRRWPGGTCCRFHRLSMPSQPHTFSEEKGRNGHSSTARPAVIWTHWKSVSLQAVSSTSLVAQGFCASKKRLANLANPKTAPRASLNAPFSICLPTVENSSSVFPSISGFRPPEGTMPSQYFRIKDRVRLTKFP